jgi:plasmid stabilization system protein ParE
MPAGIFKRASAERDLVAHYVYLAEQASIETADRFLANAGKTFSDLSRQAGMGAPLSLRDPRLTGLRNDVLTGLRNFSSSTCRARAGSRSCACCMRRRIGGVFSEFSEHQPCPPEICRRLYPIGNRDAENRVPFLPIWAASRGRYA